MKSSASGSIHVGDRRIAAPGKSNCGSSGLIELLEQRLMERVERAGIDDAALACARRADFESPDRSVLRR